MYNNSVGTKNKGELNEIYRSYKLSEREGTNKL